MNFYISGGSKGSLGVVRCLDLPVFHLQIPTQRDRNTSGVSILGGAYINFPIGDAEIPIEFNNEIFCRPLVCSPVDDAAIAAGDAHVVAHDQNGVVGRHIRSVPWTRRTLCVARSECANRGITQLYIPPD